ncbi:MAG: class I adenylate-forming enzyme family protein [Steroidobacteraceae bacterium]
MPLLKQLDHSLLNRPTQAALEFVRPDGSGLTSFTFGDFERRSNQLAALLRERNLKPGDRLAFFLQNRPEVIDLWLAAVKSGIIIVPVNVLYRERELRHILTDAAPIAVVTSHNLAGFIPDDMPAWDVDELSQAAALRATHRDTPFAAAMDTPLSLIYTSGTTGASKGAVLTHGNFFSNGQSLIEAWQFSATDRLLCTLPLFHVHGLGNAVHCWLLSGCHMRLAEKFDHHQAVAWFLDYRPTVFFGVPAMFIRLLETPEVQARTIGEQLRLAVSGSAPLPAEIHEQFRRLFGSIILERYGMTETLMNIGNPYDGERRPGTIGLPFAHVAVKICDEAGNPVADGKDGELWVKGPNVCAGYWQRPDATEAAWHDGWFRTGDLGIRAADGYITLQGRRSDLIISGGFNIYPREIEEEILNQPGVREAIVVGVVDAVRGEVPVAYVVVDVKTFDAAATATHLRSQFASFKQPRAFVQVDALPRTALGKIQKRLLPPWKG